MLASIMWFDEENLSYQCTHIPEAHQESSFCGVRMTQLRKLQLFIYYLHLPMIEITFEYVSTTMYVVNEVLFEL